MPAPPKPEDLIAALTIRIEALEATVHSLAAQRDASNKRLAAMELANERRFRSYGVRK